MYDASYSRPVFYNTSQLNYTSIHMDDNRPTILQLRASEYVDRRT